MTPLDLRFLVTPFLPREQPALGVSTLVPALARHGLRADILYLNLEFLRELPRNVYDLIAHFPSPNLLGDMLFSRALWGESASSWDDYFSALRAQRDERQGQEVTTLHLFESPERRQTVIQELERQLRSLHAEIPRIVGVWADRVLDGAPPIVGFSTTFQQNVASLALAKELRRRRPTGELVILFGGANCEGPMGQALADAFPFIDHVVSGEAESSLVDLIQRLQRREPLPRFVVGTPVQEMDDLPVPVFDDYRSTYERLKFDWPYQIPAETSRGCWWGARAHCTFCGLNGNSMAYRSKSPSRVIREFEGYRAQYPGKRLMLADNILDPTYVEQVAPALEGKGFSLFYEVKSNLRPEQLSALRAAGVDWIQPGIESLSTPVLKLMKKGATRLQNVQLLRSCREQGIKVSWNVLYGFPGEAPAEYADMAGLVESLFHLPPPSAGAPFRLDRFSPYFTGKAEGVTRVRPMWSYALVYPGVSPELRANLAYFFEFDHVDGRVPHAYAADLLAALERWGDAWHRGARLALVRLGGAAHVLDSRYSETGMEPLTPDEATLLDALRIPHTSDALATRLSLDPSWVDTALDNFRRRRWIIGEGARWMSVIVDHAGGRGHMIHRLGAAA